ncbi:MAG: hypothetical protein M0Z42_22605 [Actinomycetota bacterium]|nr:hypothetical protein [Actinomycetota bacterium]
MVAQLSSVSAAPPREQPSEPSWLRSGHGPPGSRPDSPGAGWVGFQACNEKVVYVLEERRRAGTRLWRSRVVLRVSVLGRGAGRFAYGAAVLPVLRRVGSLVVLGEWLAPRPVVRAWAPTDRPAGRHRRDARRHCAHHGGDLS